MSVCIVCPLVVTVTCSGRHWLPCSGPDHATETSVPEYLPLRRFMLMTPIAADSCLLSSLQVSRQRTALALSPLGMVIASGFHGVLQSSLDGQVAGAEVGSCPMTVVPLSSPQPYTTRSLLVVAVDAREIRAPSVVITGRRTG